MIPQPIPALSLTPEPVPSVGSPVSPNSAISTEVQLRLLLVLSSCLDFWTIDSTDVCDNAFGEGTHIEILSVYLLNPISLDILKQKAKLWLLYEVMVACWLVFFFACIVNAPSPISCTSLL